METIPILRSLKPQMLLFNYLVTCRCYLILPENGVPLLTIRATFLGSLVFHKRLLYAEEMTERNFRTTDLISILLLYVQVVESFKITVTRGELF